MSQIRIKNFGPIKSGFDENNGFMDIKKITAFIGNQGTGKSSVAKLFSILTWLEKALYREEISIEKVTKYNNFKNVYCAYQGINNYFLSITEIEFKGSVFNFSFKDKQFTVKSIASKKEYAVPKLMYVPAERNFLSVVDRPEKIKGLPQTLYTFLEEFERSQRELSGSLDLPISNNIIQFAYQKTNKTPYILGLDYKIKLSEASSGIQSLLPVFLVSRNLALSINKTKDASKKELSQEEQEKIRVRVEKIIYDDSLSEEVKEAALQLLSSKFKNACFINIVEEIEQNLFPSSQKILLFKLLEFANSTSCNQLILTTHSPYIINYLSIAIQGKFLKDKIDLSANANGAINKLDEIISKDSIISESDVVIYELSDDGSISKLNSFEGIPSDNNFLNQSLAEGNELFDSLLEIEQGL